VNTPVKADVLAACVQVCVGTVATTKGVRNYVRDATVSAHQSEKAIKTIIRPLRNDLQSIILL